MSEPGVERVLMTGDTVGGVWTFTMELAQALGAYGMEVMVATMGGMPTPSQREEAAAIRNLRLEASDYKLEWMHEPWRDVEESGEWLLSLEKRFAPDLVHLNTYGHGDLPWRSPVMLTAHSCVLSWSAAVKGQPVGPGWDRYRQAVECSLKCADLLTAPSRAMIRMIEQNYAVDLPPFRVIANGRSGSRYGAASKEPFVLSAGRLWDEAKNVAALARVAKRLPWLVYVAGETRTFSGESIEFDGCRMLGHLSSDDLATWYAGAAIYALPARYEPFGLSALEAAMSGCALVLGDIESLREVWNDAAVFVPPDDEQGLEAALIELMSDPKRRVQMANRALERARTFTPERMGSQYASAYELLVACRRMPCAS